MNKTKEIMSFPVIVTQDGFMKQNRRRNITQVGALYYPYWLASIEVSIKRLGLKPRVLRYGLLTDGMNGSAYYVKSKNNVEQTAIDVEGIKVMDSAITEEEAISEFISLAKRKVLRKYRTWWMPQIDIIECNQVYIKYWLGRIEGTDKVIHCNSFSGDNELL